MIKSISFIVLTQFFHFNKRTYFFKLNQQYILTVFFIAVTDTARLEKRS